MNAATEATGRPRAGGQGPAIDPRGAGAPFDAETGTWNRGLPADADGLRQWQLDRAWELVDALASSNPFYRDRLGERPGERTAEAFRSLPVTRKADVVADCSAHPPYGSRTTLPAGEIRHVVETSGTSGHGREVYALGSEEEAAVFRAGAVGFWWAGVRPGTAVLLTLPVTMAAAGVWYYGALRLLGANVLSVGAYPTDRKVEVLRRYEPAVIVGTPSYVGRLAAFASAAGVDPGAAGVDAIVVAGEPYGVEWARETERTWGGATLYEQYGSTERVMAWACPRGAAADGSRGTLHIPPELCHWEVIDPETGDPVAGGEAGELVCTPLAGRGSPLVRFATGDRVTTVPPGECACARPLGGILAGSVERYDDMMKIRGVNVWPATFDDVVLAVEGVDDYRGTVDQGPAGGERVVLRVECGPGAGEAAADAVGAAVRRRTGLRVTVEAVGPGTFTREVPEGFVKVSRWRDRRREAGP